MSGMASTGNSTSTTGPVTRATRPTLVSTVCAVISLFPRCGVSQRVRATDDLADFLGDLGLARLFIWRVNTPMSSLALSVADFMARRRAACSEAADWRSAL